MNDQQVRRWTGAFGVASGVLIQQVRPEYEWAATLVFGAGVVWGMLVLVSDALESASTLDTVGGQADPAAVKTL